MTQIDAAILLACAAGVMAMLIFGFCCFAEGATAEVLVNAYLVPLAMGMALVEAATWAGEHPRLGGWMMLALGLVILPIGAWFTSIFVLQFWRSPWSEMGLRELQAIAPAVADAGKLGAGNSGVGGHGHGCRRSAAAR